MESKIFTVDQAKHNINVCIIKDWDMCVRIRESFLRKPLYYVEVLDYASGEWFCVDTDCLPIADQISFVKQSLGFTGNLQVEI